MFHRDRERLPRSWKRRALIAFNVFLAFILFVGVSGIGYTKWRFGQVNKINLQSVLEKDKGSKEPMTVLLVGSDTRAELKAGQTKSFGSAKEVSGQRSDTIMVL